MLLNPGSSRCMDEILAESYRHHASAMIGKNYPVSQNMIDYTFALLSSGCTKVILEWIDKDFEESPEEMASLINTFTLCGFASISGNPA
jgi:hypothetical protein